MPDTPLQTQDFWRVNSYGYPNPFNPDTKSQEAWATFCSFFSHDNAAYTSLKAFWASSKAPRKLDGHAVESWKATFEEFGLLYVISRSNTITITPAGNSSPVMPCAIFHCKAIYLAVAKNHRDPLPGVPWYQ